MPHMPKVYVNRATGEYVAEPAKGGAFFKVSRNEDGERLTPEDVEKMIGGKYEDKAEVPETAVENKQAAKTSFGNLMERLKDKLEHGTAALQEDDENE